MRALSGRRSPPQTDDKATSHSKGRRRPSPISEALLYAEFAVLTCVSAWWLVDLFRSLLTPLVRLS